MIKCDAKHPQKEKKDTVSDNQRSPAPRSERWRMQRWRARDDKDMLQHHYIRCFDNRGPGARLLRSFVYKLMAAGLRTDSNITDFHQCEIRERERTEADG